MPQYVYKCPFVGSSNSCVAQEKKCRGTITTEASGNITPENLLSYAKTGVDYISMGALTYAAPTNDLSLKINRKPLQNPGEGIALKNSLWNCYICRNIQRMKYKRILLKLSGEALMGAQQHGIDPQRIKAYAEEIKNLHEMGTEIAIVIGGGNIFRGVSGASEGMDRVQADYMGMLATVINGLALQSALENAEVPTRLQTAIKIEAIAEPFIKRRATRHLEKGRVVIFGSGTGNPFFTTDSAAALRAVEINADVILKGTRVDGIYNADPEKDKEAVKFDALSFDEVLHKGLKVMDTTAFTISQENNLPIIVFDMNTPGNLEKVVKGENVGTRVY